MKHTHGVWEQTRHISLTVVLYSDDDLYHDPSSRLFATRTHLLSDHMNVYLNDHLTGVVTNILEGADHHSSVEVEA
jgi:hypothetical protein